MRHTDIHLRGFIIARLIKNDHNDVNVETCKDCIVYYYLYLPKNFNSFYSVSYNYFSMEYITISFFTICFKTTK